MICKLTQNVCHWSFAFAIMTNFYLSYFCPDIRMAFSPITMAKFNNQGFFKSFLLFLPSPTLVVGSTSMMLSLYVCLCLCLFFSACLCMFLCLYLDLCVCLDLCLCFAFAFPLAFAFALTFAFACALTFAFTFAITFAFAFTLAFAFAFACNTIHYNS